MNPGSIKKRREKILVKGKKESKTERKNSGMRRNHRRKKMNESCQKKEGKKEFLYEKEAL